MCIADRLIAFGLCFAARLSPAVERHHERTERHAEPTAGRPSTASDAGAAHTEASGERRGEGGGEHAGEAPGATREPGKHQETTAERQSEKQSERIFGVNPDASPLVVGAVLVSLLLAAAVWIRPFALVVLAAVVALGLGAAVFDVREVVHQADVSRTDVMVIAIFVATLHVLAAGCAGLLAKTRPKPLSSP